MPERRLQKTRDAYREPRYERHVVHDDTFDPRDLWGRVLAKRAEVFGDDVQAEREDAAKMDWS